MSSDDDAARRAAEILEQQRRFAARMQIIKSSGGGAPGGGTSNNNAKKKKSSASAAAAAAAGVIDLTGDKKKQSSSSTTSVAAASSARPSSAAHNITTQKRPSSFKRPTATSNSMPTTAAAALQQAKSRVLLAAGGGKPATADTKKPAPAAGKLSQLVSSLHPAASLNGGSADTATSLLSSSISYGQYEPEDFWRNLRDWDILTSIQKERDNNNNSSEDSLHQHTSSNNPLPNTFVSHRHYIHAWAPLVLAETRAQLLQECMSFKLPKNEWTESCVVSIYNRGGTSNNTLMMMSSTSSTMLDYVTVVVRTPQDQQRKQQDATRMPIFPHDLFLLVPECHFDKVERMYMKEKSASNTNLRKYGLIGHAEQSRTTLDGLQLKVSKKWWAVISNSDDDKFRILPLGSNITAWREFTALCRVEMIPLKRYLLGQHLLVESTATGSSITTTQPSKKKTKHSMIHAMGGVDALGKGFTEYARNKFNTSQLEAISAASSDYGEGGFTLIQGPPGSGKTTTLVAVLNSLHIRQFNKYFEEVREIASNTRHVGSRKVALNHAVRAKPRLLVCAPSNAAVDNIILKIMEEGFKDGGGSRYNPSMIRVGVGQSAAVKDVALESKVDSILQENLDLGRLESSIAGYKMELQRIQADITKLRRRVHALTTACQWPLSKDWEIRIDEETFEQSGRVYFVNHKEKNTTFEVPPPPEPGETQFDATSMPEYRAHIGRIVKLVENYNSITSKLEQCTIVQGAVGSNNNERNMFQVRQQLETHILDSVHLVMTTLGTAGHRVLEAANKFEVVVVDEAAQSVEPATLSALQLGSRHSILVGDPQQLPATIFNVSGRNTKYDRSLFQRLEEAGHKVYMLNTQYRMHPAISHFPREIFYGGNLLDGPNVLHPEYGNPLRRLVLTKVQAFQPFTILDLDSKEERGGTSLANSAEAQLAVHLYTSLRDLTAGLSAQSRVAIVTPYAQQANMLRRQFSDLLGPQYTKYVEINTVDGFQGREANIVIFSCVRAAGSHGIGFLSDVRRMNVALTRAKYFLFVIARCKSIVVNPYWRQLVDHARERNALVPVHMTLNSGRESSSTSTFPPLESLRPAEQITAAARKPKALVVGEAKQEAANADAPAMKPSDPRKRNRST